MKYLLVVLVLFGLVATAIGIVVSRRPQSVTSQAAPTQNTLGMLINDCNYLMLSRCFFIEEKAHMNIFVPTQAQKTVREHASPTFANYSESVDPQVFLQLGQPIDLGLQPRYTTSEILARVSLSSQISYRLLAAIMVIQGNDVWNGDKPAANPLNRSELSFASQLSGLASDLRKEIQAQSEIPSPTVRKDDKVYTFAPDTTSASRALTIYFAKTLSAEEFEAVVLPTSTAKNAFRNVWLELYGSPSIQEIHDPSGSDLPPGIR